MTKHVHVYCDRCGREIKREDSILVLRAVLCRPVHTDINPKAPLEEDRNTTDLCERCSTSFRGWFGEGVRQ
jgi:hypothetical protein